MSKLYLQLQHTTTGTLNNWTSIMHFSMESYMKKSMWLFHKATLIIIFHTTLFVRSPSHSMVSNTQTKNGSHIEYFTSNHWFWTKLCRHITLHLTKGIQFAALLIYMEDILLARNHQPTLYLIKQLHKQFNIKIVLLNEITNV